MEVNNFKQYSKTIRFAGRVAKEIIFTKNKAVSANNIKNDIVKMGPVYVKIGQIVSTRTDLFPNYITDVFSDLQNEVEYINYEDVINKYILPYFIENNSDIFSNKKPINSKIINKNKPFVINRQKIY